MNRKTTLIMVAVLFLTLNATATTLVHQKNIKMLSDSNEVVHKLAMGYYGNLFNYMERKEVADKVWAASGYEELVRIVNTESIPMKVRFLACEVLGIKQFTYHRDVSEETLAQIYATALAGNFTGYANSWGYLYEKEYDVGTTGGIFLSLWDKALPALTQLLDNETQHSYAGSEEATLGNSYRFRVKDFAAYYISIITRIPVAYHERHAERDKEIQALKVALKRYKPD